MAEVSLVLRAPSANRVYAQAAGGLAVAEARWVLGAHLGSVPALRERSIGGMAALEVRQDHGGTATADEADLGRLLGSLSSALGVLDVAEEGPAGTAPLLRPRDLPGTLHHSADLETILRYPGKTNEQFTAMLVNLAAALSTRRAGLFDGALALLDPLCGRGTTLNRALRLGLSPLGAEIDRKDVDAYRTFLSTWLRDHRYRHTLDSTRLTVRGEQLGTRLEVEFAAEKKALREGRGQHLTLLGCDTTRIGELLPSRSVDALVADLPYGVQHGSRAGGAWQRSPLEVLRAAAPGWRSLLRDGAGLALAVNRRTLAHDQAAAVLAEAGLRLLSPDGAFRHRVDQSIDRDVLLAVPTDHPRAEELAALAADQENDTP
ncbi:TRM11 family SAM-dependent methyltransferase [Brachybacterium sp. AOP43-C2-M15]|uniref:TRM11 family SAM-dependent methyltransferase n=1 Tax=Brachybacterium sp. AOP43-C2-M15 TaxID=3457661 RepID=UPI00403390AD